MLLICLIDLFVIITIAWISSRKGLEAALPFTAFALTLLPPDAELSLGFFQLTPQRAVILTLIVLYGLLPRRPEDSNGRNKRVLRGLILLNILWSVVSIGNSVVPVMSVKKLLSQGMEYYVVYFVCSKTIKQVRTIHKMLMGMVAAAVVCSLFGAVEVYGGWSVMELFPPVEHVFGGSGGIAVDTERGVRVSSTFEHPILFGSALAMAITMAVYLLTVAKSRAQRRCLWTAVCLMFVNIYKTGSRGPWLALAMGLVVMFMLGRYRMRRTVLVFAILITVALVLRPGVADSILGIYRNSLDSNTSEYSSYQYRYALTHAALDLLSKNPDRAVWGYGMESFYSLHLKGDFGGQMHEFLSCDNVWVGVMVETGYVGLILFVLMLSKPAIVAFRNYWRSSSDRNLHGLLFTNLVMYYFMMSSVAMYSWGQNGYMLWILISASLAYGGFRQPESRPAKRRVLMPAEEKTVLAESSPYGGQRRPVPQEPATESTVPNWLGRMSRIQWN